MNINGPKLTRERLIELLNETNASKEMKQIVLFKFDQADAITEKNNILEGDAEINAFYQAMGWERKPKETVLQAQIAKAPETGGVYAEYDEETGGSTVYDKNKNTITKYDADKNVISVTDFDGNPVTLKEEPTAPTQPTEPQKKGLTQEEINAKALSLKPGETFNYTETRSANLGSGSSAEARTVMWKRNEDGTLSRVHVEPTVQAYTRVRGRGVRLSDKFETRYSEDMQTKIYEDTMTTTGRKLNAKTRIYFENGEPSQEITNLSNFNAQQTSMTKEGLLISILRSPNFASQEIRDQEGNVILRYENGEFKNKNGRKIDDGKAYDILERAYNNGRVHDLVQNH